MRVKFYKVEDQIVFSDKELTVGEELIANTTDGAHEKHVPVVNISDDIVTVQVGSVLHPMMEAHYLEFVMLQTTTGIHTKWLKPGMDPIATFKLADGEKVTTAYEYCNLHGLWKMEV